MLPILITNRLMVPCVIFHVIRIINIPVWKATYLYIIVLLQERKIHHIVYFNTLEILFALCTNLKIH